MSVFNVIFYGDSNGRIFNLDITAKEWMLQGNEVKLLKFLDENGNVLAIFRWETIVGVCNVTNLVRGNENAEN